MSKRHSAIASGLTALVVVSILALWFSLGDGARADPFDHDNTIRRTKILAHTHTAAQPFSDEITSTLVFPEENNPVSQLSIYLHLESATPQDVRAFLVSPAGKKILVVDGRTTDALRQDGIKGWFGLDGMPTAESLDTYRGHDVHGEWKLVIQSPGAAKLLKWSLTATVNPEEVPLGKETFGIYSDGGGGFTKGSTSGCDCRIEQSDLTVIGSLLGFLVFGLYLTFRRRR